MKKISIALVALAFIICCNSSKNVSEPIVNSVNTKIIESVFF